MEIMSAVIVSDLLWRAQPAECRDKPTQLIQDLAKLKEDPKETGQLHAYPLLQASEVS